MHQLLRSVRFCINPFLVAPPIGHNGFGGRPAGQGLALFLELGIRLSHTVDPNTGFVMNVTDIDAGVRRDAVPLFAEYITQQYKQAKHISLNDLQQLMTRTFSVLKESFHPCTLNELSLQLTPYRTMTMKSTSPATLFYCEKFEFAAMHKLWNDNFTEQQNLDAFGKCANASGHGHNYWVDVTIKTTRPDLFNSIAFEKTTNDRFIDLVDHKNLNADVPHFAHHIPTIENIAEYAWHQLFSYFEDGELHSVTVWESDRTSCTYFGP
ncbi:MAG: 6-carboxytetrahydropterin synthase [Phycisphaerae bacterium]|nr:6-carboxytetrahydropterin synthase [Phycisphaerae bacterium]